MFAGFAFMPLPYASTLTLISGFEPPEKEGPIYQLKKSMGLKVLPFFLASAIVTTISTFTYGSFLVLLYSLRIYAQSNNLILIIALLSYIYGQFFQCWFFFAILGPLIGGIVFAALNFAQLLITSILGQITLIPSNIVGPMSLLLPGLNFGQVLRTMLAYEAKFYGMNFSNWSDKYQENSTQELVIWLII